MLRGDTAHVLTYHSYFEIDLKSLIPDYNGYGFRFVLFLSFCVVRILGDDKFIKDSKLK